MNRPVKLALLAGIALIALSGAASAETGKMYIPTPQKVVVPDFHNVLRDSSGNPVHSNMGGCVRTGWMGTCDKCDVPPPVLHNTGLTDAERTVYFNFGKSTLTPQAKKQLESLASKMKRGPIKEVRIIGFADRIGEPEANKRLSEKRAEAVRNFLFKQGIVTPFGIDVRWLGEAAPVTSCPAKMPKAKLVECLKEDRRVEVDVYFFAAPTDVPPPPEAVKPTFKKHMKKAAKAAAAKK